MEWFQIQITKTNLVKQEKTLDGVRPVVRGVAMNPVDHPHGGGEGRTSGGRNPVSRKGFSQRKEN